MNPRIEIAIASRGLRLDAGINGAPLVRVTDPQPQQTIVPVDWWILPEDNHLTAVVASEGDELAPSLDLSIRLTDDRERFFTRLQWQLPRDAGFEPFTIALPFTLPGLAVSPLWEECAPLGDLDPASLAAIQRAGAQIHGAFARRDVDEIVNLLGRRIDDFCAAFGDDPTDHRRAVADDFREMLASPGVVLPPANVGDLRVTPCAGGRAFHVSRGDGSELIDLRGEQLEVSMQVFVARLDRIWRVVR